VIRRAYPHLLTAALTALLAAAPAGADTSPGSGGAGLGAGGSSTTGSGPSALTQPANTTVTASGNGITVQTTAAGLMRRQLRFSGSVATADAGETVVIERRFPNADRWLPTAHATVSPGGTFTVRWRASRAGRFAIEAVLEPSPATASAAAATAGPAGQSSPALTITVYRPGRATLYGPGLWGRRTACGATLRRSTLGVASRTMRCGTRVSIMYGGQTIVVPVIDRGPFANGASWDLTAATASALGMTGTATVGAIPVS
jgi:rare lipoprotein A (peptidoglycan hydrolase)